MSNSKIYKIGFFIMLTVNVAVIGFLVMGQPHPPGRAGVTHQKDLKEEISNALNLTEKQQQQYYNSASEHREKLRLVERSQKEQAKQYLAFLRMTDPSEAKMKEVLSELSQLEMTKIETTYQHFEDLKGICIASQLADFDKVLDKVIGVLLNERENNRPPPNDRGNNQGPPNERRNNRPPPRGG